MHFCRLEAYGGPLDPDDDEVFSIEWVKLQELQQHAAKDDNTFTPWLLVEMQRMHWLLNMQTAMSVQKAQST